MFCYFSSLLMNTDCTGHQSSDTHYTGPLSLGNIVSSYLHDDRFVKIIFNKSCVFRFLNLFEAEGLTCADLYGFIRKYHYAHRDKFVLKYYINRPGHTTYISDGGRTIPDDEKILFYNIRLEWKMKSADEYRDDGCYFLIDIIDFD